MRKVAVTIPDEQMRTLEQVRRQRCVPRSRIVQQALHAYFAQPGLSGEIRAYEHGYARKPERDADARAYARPAAEVLANEDWT